MPETAASSSAMSGGLRARSLRGPRRKRGVRVFLARAQQAAQPPDPALVGAVIGRRHRAALKNAA